MNDIKKGFIITYFKSTSEAEVLLTELVKTVSKMDVYLILASHTSDVPNNIQQICDFYFYQELNIVDNRKYSHGVAENNLIEIALNHLKYKKIEWTYKCSYDVIINDTFQFEKWIQNYNYQFVSCNWGECYLATHSFFSNVNFILDNINFYHSVEDMFKVSNILELCWQQDIENKNLKNKIYTFKDKKEFYGEKNKIDVIAYNYGSLDFWYSSDEKKFYCANNREDFYGTVKIFDYYSDLCIYVLENFTHPKGIQMWFVPPCVDEVIKSKNGWYIEYHFPNLIVKSNYGIGDFEKREPLRKTFLPFRNTKEMKYHEFSELSDLDMYKFNMPNLDLHSVRNYVDVGANFGLSSIFFLRNKIKSYLIDPDETNVIILNESYSKSDKVKIIPYAISDVDGTIDFYMHKDATVVSSLFDSGDGNMFKITCPSMTPNTLMKDFVDEDYVDLMKVDIEGGEYIFFQTITDENLKKISKLIIEFHNNKNYEVLTILQKLTKNNFYFKLDNWGPYTDPYIIENKMGIIYAWR